MPQQGPRDRQALPPPDTLTPPSPMTESSPLSARASKDSHDALRSTSRQSASVAVGLTNSRFSRMVPENSCVSCVTKPMRSRSWFRSMVAAGCPL
jgi:hypothetical protein